MITRVILKLADETNKITAINAWNTGWKMFFDFSNALTISVPDIHMLIRK